MDLTRVGAPGGGPHAAVTISSSPPGRIPRRLGVMRLHLLALVLVAACGSTDGGPADEATSGDGRTQESRSADLTPSDRSSGPGSASDGTATGTEIITADRDFGTMLFDSTGQPIYLFTAEPGSRPACYDDCAEAWPPVLTRGRPVGSREARGELLGTTRRTDGTTQVTYAGHPLYFYAHEGKYEVLCHDVEEYGGTWLVVRPDGTAAAG